VIKTDETRGEAREIVSMLPVQLVISNISNPHNHKMPQNPSLGDITPELFFAGASDFVLDPRDQILIVAALVGP
jgi:hypothetical protein